VSHALLLIPALILDAIFGEPDWLWARLPHPAVLLGRAVGVLERHLNQGAARRGKGVLALGLLIGGAGTLGGAIAHLGWACELIATAILLAQKSLVDHVRAVADGLRQNLADGRNAVAMIVSRDTADMSKEQMARSAIESAAENLSDGVIAPALWFLIGGLPGLLIYKAVNTADSMIGYRTPRYAAFGWAVARCDDLLNLIPARLTGVMIACLGQGLSGWRESVDDAKRHKSPNAGWPEAAMARSLGVALAGPRRYDGTLCDLAWVNGGGRREIGADEIDGAIHILWRVWAGFLGATALLALALA